VLVTQNGLPFLFPAHVRGTTAVFASLFKRVAPYLCTQPCYFGGPFALNLATDDKHVLKVDAKLLAKRQKKRGVRDLKYWTPEVHIGAFALPAYVQQVVDAAIAEARAKGKGTEAYVAAPPTGGGEPSPQADA
jgi:spermidine synthase